MPLVGQPVPAGRGFPPPSHAAVWERDGANEDELTGGTRFGLTALDDAAAAVAVVVEEVLALRPGNAARTVPVPTVVLRAAVLVAAWLLAVLPLVCVVVALRPTLDGAGGLVTWDDVASAWLVLLWVAVCVVATVAEVVSADWVALVAAAVVWVELLTLVAAALVVVALVVVGAALVALVVAATGLLAWVLVWAEALAVWAVDVCVAPVEVPVLTLLAVAIAGPELALVEAALAALEKPVLVWIWVASTDVWVALLEEVEEVPLEEVEEVLVAAGAAAEARPAGANGHRRSMHSAATTPRGEWRRRALGVTGRGPCPGLEACRASRCDRLPRGRRSCAMLCP